MTTKKFTIPSLDGLRALSILLVFVGHADRLPQPVVPGVGVTIFFFLSGYLITTLLRLEFDKTGRVSLRDFYLRRVLKILPPMYVVIILGAIVTAVGLVPSSLSPGGIAATALHFANYWMIFVDEGIPKSMRVMWSLAVEEHFYLVFPLLYIGLRRRAFSARTQAAILAAICIMVLIWRIYLWTVQGVDFTHIYYATDTRVDSILWGCILAIIANPYLDRAWGPDWFWKLIAAPFGLIAVYVGTRGYNIAPTIGYTMQALGLVLVFTAVIRFPSFGPFRVLNWRPVVWLGVVSYSFYLVHRYFILWTDENLDVNKWIAAAIAFVMATAAAWLLHRWVERPAAKLRSRLRHVGERTEDERIETSPSTISSSTVETIEPDLLGNEDPQSPSPSRQ
ncbi:acyltransferase family protein [Rhodococcus pyridinivorans]|uniref:Peptidoglycan/LPS O-acetylase OafA/YrhL n=1 Tax=Rhodococcus rhodochrous J45 TaxID=935266 RepID=A0A562E136_RHORH|nr:acyltransferase [Rhodococcus rhodochrous]TWH15669.1 peptidoglycan/LPS O-acetylase OafA/YrhL [Rhodococcus rhodochrous J45]